MGFFSITELASTFKKPLSALHNSYKYIELENGLRTLLISDPKCNATAAAVCVGSGSFCDPADLPGLAHFCEHMLFMGTEEFPNPNDFWSKLSSMGGNSNAYTMGDYTCVYFEVSMTHTLVGEELGLNYLMKNFSSFFNKPLFSETYMNMEINSVDAEHQGNIVNDDKVLFHGLRLLSSKEHLFHRFGTGNKATLNSKHARKEMIRYYEDNFVSENMVLTLKGPLSLNQLQKLAVTNFATIPKSKRVSRKISRKRRRSKVKSNGSYASSIASVLSRDMSREIFPIDVCGKLLYIESDNAPKVRLFLPIHNFENSFYESVWCSLLGDESLGSLCHYLKTIRRCVSSIYVYVQRLSKGNKILVIDFDILRSFNLDLVIETVWKFIDQILDPNATDLARVLHEYSRVFKYQAYFSPADSSSVMEEASNYASCLVEDKIKDLEYLVTGDSFIFHGDVYDFALKTREVFDISQLNTIVLTNESNWDRPLPSNLVKDPYYRFQYAITKLNYSPTGESIPNFFILQQNSFISMSHSDLNDQLNKSCHTMPYTSESTTSPALIDFSTYHEIWHSKSSSFNVVTSFQICFSSIPNTALNLVAIEILAECLGEKLKATFYQGELALFSWGIFANLVTTPSLSFEIQGPISGFLYFLKEFIVRVKNSILTFNLDYKEFVTMKSQLRRNYDELENGETNTKVMAASVMTLEQGIASIEDRFEAVELLETSYFSHLCDLILQDYKHTDILVTGGDREFATKVCKTINIITSHEKIYFEKPQFDFASSVELKRGRNYDLVLENSNSDDPNDVVYHYIQLCPRNDKSRIIAHFLAYQMNQFVRYQLRTRRQVGYLILSGIRINKSTIGLYLLINSSSYDYQSILSEIEQVLFEWELEVLTMAEDQLSDQFESFLKNQDQSEIDTVPSNISAATKPTKQSDNYVAKQSHLEDFESIITKNYDFGSEDSEQSCTKCHLDEVIQFFREKISIKSTQRVTLSILVSSKKGKTKRDFEDGKEMLQSILNDHAYQLTSLQLSNLLNESNNDVSVVIQKLRSLGYKISTKQKLSLFKVLYMIKNFTVKNSRESERLQSICVAKYGDQYRTSEGVLPHLRVSGVGEIHAEAYFMSQGDHLSQLQDIYDDENDDDYFNFFL